MNLVDIVSYLNQPPSLLEIAIDIFFLGLLAVLCYLGVWFSSKLKPLAENRSKEYLLWGVLYSALLCFLPYVLPHDGSVYYSFVIYLLSLVFSPSIAHTLYALYSLVLRPLLFAIALSFGEFFILRGLAQDKSKLKKALILQSLLSLVLYLVLRPLFSSLSAVWYILLS